MMELKDVRHLAIEIKGDDYYEEFRLLKSDMEFFNMYIQRNKQSNFSFILIPTQFSYYKPFKDVYEAFALGEGYLEEVYFIYTVLKSIILDVYNETNKISNDVIKEFNLFMKHDLELDMCDYVSGFVGCSHGTQGTLKRIYDILHDGG